MSGKITPNFFLPFDKAYSNISVTSFSGVNPEIKVFSLFKEILLEKVIMITFSS